MSDKRYSRTERTTCGGKGGDAPAPDPRLADAQISAMNSQQAIAAEQAGIARELLPLQQEQLRFGLDTARSAYQQSQEDRAYALARRNDLDSAMRPFLDEAANFNEGARRSELMKEAGSDITQAFDAAQGQQTRGLQRQGVTMNSGRAAALQQQSELAEATARAAAGRKVSEAAKAEGLALRTNAVNMLNGAPAMATQATASGAGYGTAGLGLTNAGVSGMTGGLGAAGSSYGNIASTAGQLYNQQLSSANSARTAANGQSADMWGTVAGIGFAALSDRRLKQNIKAVGTLDNGATVYTYQYAGGDGTTHMGVMADELLDVAPDAVVQHPSGYLAVNYSMI